MNINIKYAFLNLSRKPIFTILTILQLVVSVMLLYSSISAEQYISTQTDNLRGVYKNKNLYSIAQFSMPDLNDIKTENLERFNKYLKNASSFMYISVNDTNAFVNIGENSGEFIKSYNMRTIDNEEYQIVYTLEADETCFKEFDFKVNTGRIFKEEDFHVQKNKPIPVILGDSYKNIYKTGDILKYLGSFQTIEEYEVVGFLEKGYYLADGQNPGSLRLLDKYIIVPHQEIILDKTLDSEFNSPEDIYKINLINDSFNGFINIDDKDKDKEKNIMDGIILEAKRNGFDIKIVSVEETIKKLQEGIDLFESKINFLLMILSIFTTVGIIASLSHSILSQTKEFGIHIMHGAVLGDMAKRVVCEIMLMFSVANLCSLLIIVVFLKKDYILKFSIYNFSITLILSIAFSLLLSIIPVWKIMKFSVEELIRGKE